MARLNISVPDDVQKDIKFLREIKHHQSISKICQKAISTTANRRKKMLHISAENLVEFKKKKNALMTREELVLRLRRSKQESDLRKEYGL